MMSLTLDLRLHIQENATGAAPEAAEAAAQPTVAIVVVADEDGQLAPDDTEENVSAKELEERSDLMALILDAVANFDTVPVPAPVVVAASELATATAPEAAATEAAPAPAAAAAPAAAPAADPIINTLPTAGTAAGGALGVPDAAAAGANVARNKSVAERLQKFFSAKRTTSAAPRAGTAADLPHRSNSIEAAAASASASIISVTAPKKGGVGTRRSSRADPAVATPSDGGPQAVRAPMPRLPAPNGTDVDGAGAPWPPQETPLSNDAYDQGFQALKLTFDSYKIRWSKQLGQYVQNAHTHPLAQAGRGASGADRRCGHSGMFGVVYKATYVPLNAPVAVKVIDLRRPMFAGRALARLREEIAIMQRVTHVRRARPPLEWSCSRLTRCCCCCPCCC
jgi:hypothetical protein